jgi:hypothetical protein
MEEMTTDSGTPPFTILITSRLVSGFCVCWPNSGAHRTAQAMIKNVRLKVLVLIA